MAVYDPVRDMKDTAKAKLYVRIMQAELEKAEGVFYSHDDLMAEIRAEYGL